MESAGWPFQSAVVGNGAPCGPSTAAAGFVRPPRIDGAFSVLPRAHTDVVLLDRVELAEQLLDLTGCVFFALPVEQGLLLRVHLRFHRPS